MIHITPFPLPYPGRVPLHPQLPQSYMSSPSIQLLFCLGTVGFDTDSLSVILGFDSRTSYENRYLIVDTQLCKFINQISKKRNYLFSPAFYISIFYYMPKYIKCEKIYLVYFNFFKIIMNVLFIKLNQ